MHDETCQHVQTKFSWLQDVQHLVFDVTYLTSVPDQMHAE